eukprot:CAMPEP_0201609202 /NCGR_PEP_ID=MMETSP0492-20130828/12601_1 /ASSEMBLY_ACC=CAM_ASM_000837 /TAXON_ID=420259 /ORGANISM="Thalassiosira gravida, Strain GMp14c1" /LENGTH=59 /DNA_ID=CAMNT_0048074539 /DNA_START=35 /DNA_END=214 /DNA_ORIENTATION=+
MTMNSLAGLSASSADAAAESDKREMFRRFAASPNTDPSVITRLAASFAIDETTNINDNK